MVAATQFNILLETLGGRELELLDETKNWNLYAVKFRTPAGEMRGQYLYLASDCPFSEATSGNLTKWRSHSPYTVVVTTKSRLAQDLERVRKEFRGSAATTPRNLLIENVMQGVFTPKQGIEEFRYFVEPELTINGKTSKPALSYLVDSLTSTKSVATTSVRADILVAPAGLGKTTLCRAIAHRILSAYPSTIPILVESAQWQDLINLTLPNVLNTALLQLIPDAAHLTHPKVFELLVREQVLVPIFDGFDELSLHPSAKFSPASLLSQLLDLVGDAGARVLITVREAFWEKHAEGLRAEELGRLRRLNLQGFSNDQRKKFFLKRLNDPAERDIANRLSREIGSRLYEGVAEQAEQQRDRASGVPLMLELIALYVDGNPSATFAPPSHDPLGPLLTAVCERENVRQKLDITPEKQMLIFEELFRDHPAEIALENLKFYLELSVPEITSDTMERFESHAFFSSGPGKSVIPRFETLRVYFVARWLANRLEAASETPIDETATRILERQALGSSDIFDYLVEIFVTGSKEKSFVAIAHAYQMVRSRTGWEGACSALFHLSQRLAHHFEKTKQGRVSIVRNLMGTSADKPEVFFKIAVQGQISGLDLMGKTFESCEFKNLEFHNCNFDEHTKFIKVRFNGGLNFTNCIGVNSVSLIDCSCSEPALDAWSERQDGGKRRTIDEETAKDAIRGILRKFVTQFGFSTLKESDRHTGPIVKNPCREKTWEAFLGEGILERHHISGVTGGGLKVVKDKDIRHEVRNFLDNAAMGPRLKRVLSQIVSHR